MDELDNSYLSLLFDEQVYIEKSAKSDKKYSLVIFSTHSKESIFEENLLKCFQRLSIDLSNALRTENAIDIKENVPCMIFSDQAISTDLLPPLKYSVVNKTIWFDNFETISKDAQLKLIFWDKFQEFFKTIK